MLKKLILRKVFQLLDVFQICAKSHHCILRLKEALRLPLTEDIIVTDRRTEMKQEAHNDV